MWYKVSGADQNEVVCGPSLIDPSCQRTHGSCLVCFCFDDRWGGFVCANNPICSEVDPVFWLVKSLKPHNDDSQSGPWLTEEVRGTHQLLPMNHKERISKKNYDSLKKQDKKKNFGETRGFCRVPSWGKELLTQKPEVELPLTQVLMTRSVPVDLVSKLKQMEFH